MTNCVSSGTKREFFEMRLLGNSADSVGTVFMRGVFAADRRNFPISYRVLSWPITRSITILMVRFNASLICSGEAPLAAISRNLSFRYPVESKQFKCRRGQNQS
jgi:hypothetical protein